MILITGGAYQGKLAFAQQKIEKDHPIIAGVNQCSMEELEKAHIISDFHLTIKEWLKEKKDPCSMTQKLLEQNPKVILIMNQLGCGIVPIDAFDREYREITGRIGCTLAKQAEEVWLVNAGIGMKLK